MGVPGPCGPCSEIYFDRGPRARHATAGRSPTRSATSRSGTSCSCSTSAGEGPGYDYPIIGELPARNIDTGLGLERMATILQGVENLYEIDISRPVLDRAGELTGKRYGADHDADVSLRVVADHMRTGAMLISDGVTPTQRGPRLRAAPAAAPGASADAQARRARSGGGRAARRHPRGHGPDLPGARRARRRIGHAGEEEAFRVDAARRHDDLRHRGAETRGAGSSELSGERAFQLHDTYGFPYDAHPGARRRRRG